MIEAVSGNITGRPAATTAIEGAAENVAGFAPGGHESRVLELFGKWCAAITYVAPSAWPERRKEAAYARSGDRASRAELALAALPDLSPVQVAAILWIRVWTDHCSIDPDCPVLPHQRHDDSRRLVLGLAARFPQLAAVAGLSRVEN